MPPTSPVEKTDSPAVGSGSVLDAPICDKMRAKWSDFHRTAEDERKIKFLAKAVTPSAIHLSPQAFALYQAWVSKMDASPAFKSGPSGLASTFAGCAVVEDADLVGEQVLVTA